jgi:hypothetical protein
LVLWVLQNVVWSAATSEAAFAVQYVVQLELTLAVGIFSHNSLSIAFASLIDVHISAIVISFFYNIH